MKRQLVLAFVLALSARYSAASAPPDPNNYDILGIKLGMSIDQTQTLLKEHDPNIVIQIMHRRDNLGNPITSFIHAFDGKTNAQSGAYDISENFVIFFTATIPQKALLISRSEILKVGTQPTYENFVDQLVSKFGTPSDSSSGGETSWFFDAKGNQITSQGLIGGKNDTAGGHYITSSECDLAHNGQVMQVYIPQGLGTFSPFTAPVFYYTRFNHDCGISLVIGTVKENDLVRRFTETLASDQIAISDIQAQNAASQAQQAQQRAKASGVNGPNL